MIRASSRTLEASVIVLAVALVLPSCSRQRKPSATDSPVRRSSSTPSGQTTDETVAQTPVTVLFVNGEAITADDILKPVRQHLADQAATMAPDRYQQHAVELLRERIRAAARDLLLHQEAMKGLAEQELEQLDSFVDARVRDIVNSQHAGRQTRYEKALAQKGTTIQDDRDRIRRELIVQRYIYQNVNQRLAEPTRRELWQHFQQQKDELRTPPRRKMFLIEITRTEPIDVIASGDGSTQPADAGDMIARAKSELDAGTDFAAVAKTYSTGIHASEGGDWAWVERDSVRERWRPAVDVLFEELEAGQHSGVIATDEAFFIVKCGEIDSGQEPDFQALQAQLLVSYREHEFNELVNDLVAKLQASAVIDPPDFSRFLRGVYNAAPQPLQP